MLVVNREGEQEAIEALEGYELPVLQDTVEADVFGLWEASSYDLYIVDRDGVIAFADSGALPTDSDDQLIEALAEHQ